MIKATAPLDCASGIEQEAKAIHSDHSVSGCDATTTSIQKENCVTNLLAFTSAREHRKSGKMMHPGTWEHRKTQR